MYCGITNYTKTCGLKQQILLTYTTDKEQESRDISVWWFWLRISYVMQSGCLPGLQSSEGLTGAGKSTFKMANMAVGLRALFFVTYIFPHVMAAGFCPDQVIQENNQNGSCDVFSDLICDMTQSLPPYSTHHK